MAGEAWRTCLRRRLSAFSSAFSRLANALESLQGVRPATSAMAGASASGTDAITAAAARDAAAFLSMDAVVTALGACREHTRVGSPLREEKRWFSSVNLSMDLE